MWLQQFIKNMFYFGNFYRAFKNSNNYVATMLMSVIYMSFELWLRWCIHKQFGDFYWVKAYLQLVNLLQVSATALLYLLFNWYSGAELPVDEQSYKNLGLKKKKKEVIDHKALWDLDKTS